MIKKNLIIILLLVFCITNFSLSSNYSKLLKLCQKKEDLNKKEIEILYKIFNLNKSEKWFAGYILYKNTKEKNKNEEIKNFPQLFYKLSYIKDDELLLDYIDFLLKRNRIEQAYSVIQNEKRYYFRELKEKILEHYQRFRTKYSKEELDRLVYSMGYYQEVIELKPNKDLLIKSVYGLRDYTKCIQLYEKNLKKEFHDDTLYYVSRSYASLGKYDEAVNVLENIDYSIRSLYRYYINYYKLKSGLKLELNNIEKSINNSYYYGKLVYQSMAKGHIDDIMSVYSNLHDSNFLKAKIWFKFRDTIKDNGESFLDSPYFDVKNNYFKKNRNIKKYIKYFKPDNKTVHKIVQINPDFVYNDLLLTGSENGEEKCFSYYKNYLPYYGLKQSFRINTKNKEYLRYPLGYVKEVLKASEITSIDPFLIFSIIREESSFKWDVSERGATGLMQIMPGTSKWLKNLYNLKSTDNKLFDHILEGSYYLKYLMNKYDGTENPVIYSIMAYNAGQGNVDKWINKYRSIDKVLLNIPFFETERYLFKVYRSYKNYMKIYG